MLSNFKLAQRIARTNSIPSKLELVQRVAGAEVEVARLAFQAKAAVASEHQKYKVGIMAARDDGQRYEDILTSNDRTREVKPMDTPFEAKVKPMDTPFEAKVKPMDTPFEAKVKPMDTPIEAKVKPMDTPFEAKVKPMDTPLEAGGG